VVGPGLHVQAMTHDRRTEKERRDGTERRRGSGARGFLLRLLKGERRQLEDRRRGRGGEGQPVDRRSQQQTATDLVRSAFEMIAVVLGATDATLDDETRQRLDSALVRLKFAIERLEKGQQGS